MLQLTFVNFKPNSYILMEGKPWMGKFFIIQSGKVQCFRETAIPGFEQSTLGPGDFVGVVSCMSGHSQIESVIAVTPVVAIMVDREQYPELIMKNTAVAMKIVRSFAREMRNLNDRLTRAAFNNTVAEDPAQMYDIGNFYEKSGFSEIAAYVYYQYMKECPTAPNIPDVAKKYKSITKMHKPPFLESTGELTRCYPKNTMIFSECQHGADMFIIQEGSVKISKVIDDQEVILAILGKGDMFGEMALLEDKPRSAIAIAHESCTVMIVNKNNFDQMVATQPQLVSRLTTTLSDRLWSMYRQVANTQLKNLRARMVDMLSIQIEKQKGAPVDGKYRTGLTTVELINLCGISAHDRSEAIYQLEQTQNIKINLGEVIIEDVKELLKQAAFFRKQYK